MIETVQTIERLFAAALFSSRFIKKLFIFHKLSVFSHVIVLPLLAAGLFDRERLTKTCSTWTAPWSTFLLNRTPEHDPATFRHAITASNAETQTHTQWKHLSFVCCPTLAVSFRTNLNLVPLSFDLLRLLSLLIRTSRPTEGLDRGREHGRFTRKFAPFFVHFDSLQLHYGSSNACFIVFIQCFVIQTSSFCSRNVARPFSYFAFSTLSMLCQTRITLKFNNVWNSCNYHRWFADDLATKNRWDDYLVWTTKIVTIQQKAQVDTDRNGLS